MRQDVETPSFTFRLERVRSLREQAEDQAREALAHELSLRLRGEAMLRQARELASAARESGVRSVERGGMTGTDLRVAQAWIEHTERGCREAALDLDRQEAEVAARRAALAAAAQDREAIERLKRRRAADHERAWARKAQSDLDEIALGVHRRGALA